MTVKDVQTDTEARTLTITAELDATVERAWQLWADPRQLERWWGPPTYPATFVEHDLTPGSRASYYMTSPEGDRHFGWWEIVAVDPPRRLEVRDGFADDQGRPVDDMPTGVMVVTFEPATPDGGTPTTMTVTSHFPTPESMQQLLEMGQAEGMREAMGQIDAILAG